MQRLQALGEGNRGVSSADPGDRRLELSIQLLLQHCCEFGAEAAELTIEQTDSKISLNAKVSSDDIGRVIGKRGRVANSIRTLVRAAAVKDGVEVEVDFSD